MTQRYNCNEAYRAIHTYNNGFMFGNAILRVRSDTTLNQHMKGECWTGKGRAYDDIEGDVSPLTNQKTYFTCAQLEVYKIVYN